MKIPAACPFLLLLMIMILIQFEPPKKIMSTIKIRSRSARGPRLFPRGP
jgi:hypothetical protein